MKLEEILKTVNKAYPLISKDNNCTAKVEYHYNIYERLSGEKGMTGEVCAHAEYDWSNNKIYLYTSRLHSAEDIIRALIHECVHSTQSKVIFDQYYKEGFTYDNHPYEIEARNAEEEWKIYLNELNK
tara:strand:+ start:125 stop:505 length:381 start_codon:yes stop_codon:yes gene_type:complete